MKFRFCGDLDAPDWILAEISVLAKISFVKAKLLAVQVVRQLLGGQISFEAVAKLNKSGALSASDVKAAIAALNFILSNAVKYNVEDSTLSLELQQLGLPREHSEAIAKPYRNNRLRLREVFGEDSFSLPRLASVDWRVDTLLASSSLATVEKPTVQLALTLETVERGAAEADGEEESKSGEDGGDADVGKPGVRREEVAFELDASKFRVLLSELKTARALMEQLE
eukprot:PLAT8541.1.p3 GENE.PLAT8541.1~~PLAT8541.1.p3  ORF type:complete len:226 (+),score=118.92 PLAT8541.1:38-715(+)